jgi:syntaxin 1B/2/3
MIDEIETRVEATATAVEQGVSELTQANKNAAAARKKKWIVFWIVILILIILGIVIAIYFGGQKKN